MDYIRTGSRFLRSNKTGFNPKIFHFHIRRKLFKIHIIKESKIIFATDVNDKDIENCDF